MKQSLLHVSLVVRDYDEALDFYVGKLGFVLVEDSHQPEQNKRWVVIAPPTSHLGESTTTILLAKASNDEQLSAVGNQTGGRVFLFLQTDDFDRDYNLMKSKGIRFARPPKNETYGKVAVFVDLYGNQWDLIQLSEKPKPKL